MDELLAAPPSSAGAPAPLAPAPRATEPAPSEPPGRLRFGDFTLDARTGELRRGAEPLKIPPQPARALQYLLEQRDRLVSRQELQRVLWSDGRHVDFDQGLNYCIRQLREILGDDAEVPRYIATVPRRGYRFVAPVSVEGASEPRRAARWPRTAATWALVAATAALSVAATALLMRRAASPPATEPRVAVLPLGAPSGDDEDRLTAHVLHEELVVSLAARAPRLAVIEPAAVEPGAPPAPYRLEGSVYRVGEELTLTLQLVRSGDGVTLWADTFRQPIEGTDWLAWPPEAAAAIEAALAGASVAAPATRREAAEELAMMERGFAGVASRRGIREAFLAYLAEEAVVLQPTAMPGRPTYAALPPDPDTRLSWQPVTAAVAASGELGYTTGHRSMRRRAEEPTPTAFGQFLSVWQRNERGQWRLLVDSGIGHAEQAAAAPFAAVAASSTAASSTAATRLPAAAESVEQVERAYCAELARQGPPAFARRAHPDVRLLRQGHLPVVGSADALALLSTLPLQIGCEASGSRTSASQDLAATWGVGSMADGSGFAFLRVWSRTGDEPWRLAVDLAKPVAPQAG